MNRSVPKKKVGFFFKNQKKLKNTVSFLYLGNLCFRLLHNVIFGWLAPRNRVIVSILSLFLSMTILVLVSFIPAMHKLTLAWVFIAYGLGGLGIGTFEANLLCTITPLGSKTKMWAILAIPFGIVMITIGAFVLLQVGVYAGYIWAGVAVCLLLSIFVYIFRIYSDSVKIPAKDNINLLTIADFWQHIKEIKFWGKTIGKKVYFFFVASKLTRKIVWYCVANIFDMFCVSVFSPGVILYIYDKADVTFKWTHTSIPTYWFFAIYDGSYLHSFFFHHPIFSEILFSRIFRWRFFFQKDLVSNKANFPPLLPPLLFRRDSAWTRQCGRVRAHIRLLCGIRERLSLRTDYESDRHQSREEVPTDCPLLLALHWRRWFSGRKQHHPAPLQLVPFHLSQLKIQTLLNPYFSLRAFFCSMWRIFGEIFPY